MESSAGDRSTWREACNTPAECLYLADPNRLSVLGIKIIALASLVDYRTGASNPSVPSSSIINGAAPRSAGKTASTNPPSSYRNPTQGARTRPRSVELGHRAKEAFLDIGRGVSNGWKSISRSDLHDGNESQGHLGEAGNDDRLTTSTSTDSYSSQPLSTPTTSNHSQLDEPTVCYARQVYSLRPHSLTNDASLSASHSSASAALHVENRLERQTQQLSVRQTSVTLPWDKLGQAATEFVWDNDRGAAADARAGIFSSIENGDLDASDDEDNEGSMGSYDNQLTPDTSTASIPNSHKLLLKVAPPMQYLRDEYGSGRSSRENVKITIRARLRVGNARDRAAMKARLSPAGPRSPRLQGGWAREKLPVKQPKIIFLSTTSSKKLYDAVDSTRLHRTDASFSGPLSSAGAARLEGIEWVPIGEQSSQSGVINFEWDWKELDRGTNQQTDAFGQRIVKCVCAYIELDEEAKGVRILAAHTFAIQLPRCSLTGPMRQSGLPETTSDVTSLPLFEGQIQPRRFSGPSWQANMQKRSSQTQPSPALVRGIGLGLADEDCLTPNLRSEEPFDVSTPTLIVDNTPFRTRCISAGTDHTSSPLAARRRLSHQSKTGSEQPRSRSEAIAKPLALQVDFTEISLADVEEDGPILRAALANLERRTFTLKKAAKALIKSSSDVRAQLGVLQASQASFEQTLEAVALLAPSTLGHLNAEVLQKMKKEEARRRDAERSLLHTHVEAPLQAVVDLCRAAQEQIRTFETESKAYYTATQKWLSSRSSSTSTGGIGSVNGVESGEIYSPSAVGFDRASLKQEREDEKQRLRQSRFHLARLEVYRAINTVHGGEAELEIARNLLIFCRSQCLEESARIPITSMEMGLRMQSLKEQERNEQISNTVLSCERQISGLQSLLGKSTTADGEGQQHTSALAIPTSESENALGAATRQAGLKIKNMLASIGANKQAQGISFPSVSHESSASDDSPTKVDASRKLTKSPSKGEGYQLPALAVPAVSQTNRGQGNQGINGATSAFAKLQQRLRPTSFVESNGGGVQQERESGYIPSAPATFEPASRHTPAVVTSPSQRDPFAYSVSQSSPSPRRSLSIPSSPLTTSQIASVELSYGAHMTPTSNRHSKGAKNRASSDSQRPTRISLDGKGDSTSGAEPSRRTLLQPRRAAQQQARKKEGILWAMSKPIAGAAGADTPKAVSRSQNWRECWVVLSGSGHLGQYADWKDVKIMEPSQPLIDLRFATVREGRGIERRFTFEVVTRDCRRFFQASNEAEMREWMAAISFAIESLLNGTSSIRQIDKVARNAGGVSPFMDGNEFGSHAAIADGRIETATLGQHRAFSQSLTDLTSASSGPSARLFQRNSGGAGSAKDEASRKRDSRVPSTQSGHLSTLSEGGGAGSAHHLPAQLVSPSTPSRSSPWTRHERGISNKTPLSGYVQSQQDVALPDRTNGLTRSASAAHYDKRIEEMVHTSFGGGSSTTLTDNRTHRRSASNLSSSTSTRHVSQIESIHETEGSASRQTASQGNDKYHRAKEIIDEASKPGNTTCADCRAGNATWASWNLNGQPRCIFICISCSGVHRGLGVSISRVKSVELDDWTEEQLDSARKWGNDRVNALYEATKPATVTSSSLGDVKTKEFWMEKYIKRTWYAEPKPKDGTTSAIDPLPRASTESAESMNSLIESPLQHQTWDGTWQGAMGGVSNLMIKPDSQRSPPSVSSPTSPPVVFVSMMEGDRTAWGRGSGEMMRPTLSDSSSSPIFSNRPSMDAIEVNGFTDQGPFAPTPVTVKSGHHVSPSTEEQTQALRVASAVIV